MVSKPRKVVGKPSSVRDEWPLVEAIALRIKQIGNQEMALGDIQEALVAADLHVKRRSEVTGKFENLPSEFWIDYEIHYKVSADGTPQLTISRRRGWFIVHPHPDDIIPGHFFYASRCEYDKLWSLEEPELPRAGKPAEKQTELSQGGKPGRKTTDKWKFHAASVICRIVLEEGRKPTAKDVSDVLDKMNINLTPDRREINRLIAGLLRLLE